MTLVRPYRSVLLASLSLLLMVVGGPTYAQLRSSVPLLKNETTPEKNLKVFDAMWEKVNRKYFDVKFNGVNWAGIREQYRPLAEKAQSREALLTVLRQAVGELNTSHVRISLAVSRRAFEKQVGQKINRHQDNLVLSPGFDVTRINSQYVITTIQESSSAALAGIQPGWVLTHLDGKSLAASNVEWGGEFSEGRSFSARFQDNQQQERDVTLQYQWLIEKPERVSQMLAGDFLLVRFSSFSAYTDKWLTRELAQHRKARGIVLDLRGNPGGYMSVLRHCLDLFFANEVVVGEFIERSSKDNELKIKGSKSKACALPLVILVDEKSTSCAEIFAAAMQETGRGKVIGRRTAGAVLASVAENLPDDFRLDIAIWDYKTARRRRLEGRGIEPDITVPLTLEDIRQRRDVDLARALEILRSGITN